MKTRLLGGVAALLVAIVGTVLLLTYIQNADKRALASTETESVYVLSKPVPAGSAVGDLSDSLIRKAIPKLALTPGAVTDLAQVENKVTTVDLVPGEQLITSRLVDADAYLGPARVAVPPGMQEFTLRLPIERVAGGKIAAGDTAGVFISLDEIALDPATGATQTTSSATQLTFHKVLVTAAQFSDGAAADASTASKESSTAPAKGDDTYLITLARNSVDAEKIIHAVEYGKVYLSKEPTDAAEDNTGVVNGSKVFK